MRPMIRLGAVLAGLALGPAAAEAAGADVTGVWLTGNGHGEISIEPCGASICGRLMSSDQLKADPGLRDEHNANPALRGRPLMGLTILQGFQPNGAGWTGGSIYNPKDGATIKASLQLAGPDSLKLTGCLAPLVCQSRIWARAK